MLGIKKKKKVLNNFDGIFKIYTCTQRTFLDKIIISEKNIYITKYEIITVYTTDTTQHNNYQNSDEKNCWGNTDNKI